MLMLIQRLQRRPSIIVLCYHSRRQHLNHLGPQKTTHIDPMLDKGWASVADVGPALIQRVNVSCLLGCLYAQQSGK